MKLKKLLSTTLIIFSFTLSLSAATIHVSPTGNDANDGSKAKPFATIKKAVETAQTNAAVSEIIIKGGIYTGGVSVDAEKDKKYGKLLISAAKSKDGKYEKVIVDGGYYIKGAEAVSGSQGVYRVKVPAGYNYFRHRPDMAEIDSRVRYRRVADLMAIKAYAASFEVIGDNLYFHTSDNKPASEHNIVSNISGERSFLINRNNVTVKGINLKTCGFGIVAEGVTLEKCSAWNVRRVAFYVSSRSKNTRIFDCLARDVGGAFYTEGKYTTIENCRAFRIHDSFESTYIQEKASGIQVYSPAQHAVVRGNLVAGFKTGIFIKAHYQNVVLENNTAINGTSIGIGCTMWFPGTIMRNNIVYGYKKPFLVDTIFSSRYKPENLTIDNNALWASTSDDLEKVSLAAPLEAGTGYRNIKANPCFVSIKNEDFRLLPESPLARFLPGGKPIGALPVAENAVDNEAPQVELKLKKPSLLLETVVKKFFAKDPWNLGLPEGSTAVPRFESSEVESDGQNRWVVAGSKVQLIISAKDNFFKVTEMQVKIADNEWQKSVPFSPLLDIDLPEGKDSTVVQVKVSDKAGNWSEPAQIIVFKAVSDPVVKGEPAVFANNHGAVIHFNTSVPALVKIEWGITPEYGNEAEESPEYIRYWSSGDGGEWIYKKQSASTKHMFTLIPDKLKRNRKIYYRFILDDGVGHKAVSEGYEVVLKGKAKKYYIDPKQTETGDGSLKEPFALIQTALDRALPGDEVILKEGFYHEAVYLNHGGKKGAPLTIKAADNAKVYIDGKQEMEYLIRIVKADYVVLSGMEMRWFLKSAVSAAECKNLTIENCRFWNKHWGKGWPSGNAFAIMHSPSFKLKNSLLCAMNGGGQLFFSPGFEIINCTGNYLLHRGVRMVYSSRNSVFKNNSFTFTGNDHIAAIELKKDWDTFYCDYNNFAAYVRKAAIRRPPPEEDIVWKSIPGNRAWVKQCKHINLLRVGWGKNCKKILSFNLAEWQKFSGKDKNSIYKLPKYVDPIKRNYALQTDSPNVGSGEKGADIGAYGAVK
ncbi:MAG: right-handed parallel beta-helix repeat-containing protein [Planctomycetota bacterium]|jgi:hypothetical protein